MIQTFFSYLDALDDQLWTFIGFPIVFILGLFFTWQTGFIQIRKFPIALKNFWNFLFKGPKHHDGVHPIQAFFACLGGCVGIGNIVAVCTAVQIGGPGALFWVWVTATGGMLLKYAEVYLGFLYRVSDGKGGHKGGPMYFLQRAFPYAIVPMIVSVLLCIYGAEIYQFSIITHSISENFATPHVLTTIVILALVLWVGSGGVGRVGLVSSAIIPIFMVLYLGMSLWIILQNLSTLPGILQNVLVSAFTGHAAIGGFAGSSILLAISQGIKRGCYSIDVGVGYASIMHSESSSHTPEKQSSLVIFDVFLDTFLVCTPSILLILVTGVWSEPIPDFLLVQTALAKYFPYMEIFFPCFIFFLGFSTIIAYFCFGLRSAEYLSPRFGRPLYYVYTAVILFCFSFIDTTHALVIMSLTQVALIFLNLLGIFRLRKEISFQFDLQ